LIKGLFTDPEKENMKVCTDCGICKELECFSIRKDSKDGHRNKCKECIKLKQQQYHINNKEKNYLVKLEYIKSNPWYRLWSNAKSRCLAKSHHYYKRGIKNFLKVKDVKYLWERDNADKLIKPSIDRINNNGHYTIQNCQIMELAENLKKR